jgi:hypothetical protein
MTTGKYLVIQDGAGATTGLIIDSSFWAGSGNDLFVASEAGKKLLLSAGGTATPAITIEPTPAVIIHSILSFTGIPTSDPGVVGQVWNDSGTLKISI